MAGLTGGIHRIQCVKASGRQRKTCSVVAKEIAAKQKQYVTRRTVNNYLIEKDEKRFMLFQNRSDLRLTYQIDYDSAIRYKIGLKRIFFISHDLMNLLSGLFIDQIWAKSADDIEEDERYREMIKNQACIGSFVIFTAKRLHWLIKNKDES